MREFKKLKNEEVLEWLKRNDYISQVGEVTLKSIVRAVAIDMVEFASEALRCTIRGPLTVAIALFRKPFKENLFILEWIVGDPADYFDRFFSGDASQLSLSALPPSRKVDIIRAAMAKTVYQEWIPADFIYSLRYDKQSQFGFEYLWQHANHLITTQGKLKTEAENLNFVFSTEDDRDAQWRAFYTMAPILFFHALEVLEAAITYFASFKGGTWGIMRLRNLAGMYLWMRSPGCVWNLGAEKILGTVVRGFLRSIACSCGKRVSWREANIRTFFVESKVRCFSCGETIEILGEDETSANEASHPTRGPTSR